MHAHKHICMYVFLFILLYIFFFFLGYVSLFYVVPQRNSYLLLSVYIRWFCFCCLLVDLSLLPVLAFFYAISISLALQAAYLRSLWVLRRQRHPHRLLIVCHRRRHTRRMSNELCVTRQGALVCVCVSPMRLLCPAQRRL